MSLNLLVRRQDRLIVMNIREPLERLVQSGALGQLNRLVSLARNLLDHDVRHFSQII
jgi:hypothetical protein